MAIKYIGKGREFKAQSTLYSINCPHCGKEIVLEIAVTGNQITVGTGLRTGKQLDKAETFTGRQVA